MYDIAVIGGGVNGCGIARDAAGRGLKVLLVEKNDLASGTSAASTKLIHGGLRYLEHYEFRLVREALKEREVLWSMAPHIIWPLRFVLPHHRGLRPWPLLRFGLFLYDHLGGREHLPASGSLDLQRDAAGQPLKEAYRRAFEYSDCWVDDVRLVVLNARDAAGRGADIQVRTSLEEAVKAQDAWTLTLKQQASGRHETTAARILVNATGPWVAEVVSSKLRLNSRMNVRLVKGSHIVVPRHFDHDRAYIFQNDDHRIVFAIPYEQDFTLIGTTDIEFDGDPADVAISQEETDYLCRAVNQYFRHPISAEDVVHSYAGVRPLFDDGSRAAQKVTRDFTLELIGEENQPPLLNVYGGKITTYRRLAEDALAKLAPWLPATAHPWTRDASLPGGDKSMLVFDHFLNGLYAEFPRFPRKFLQRLARSYGTCAREILGDAQTPADLGLAFGSDLYQREVEYLISQEWAETADDILWRRSKLGLRLNLEQKARLQEWLTHRQSRMAATG